jgi:Family of unknown function (DUF5522)
MAAPHPSRLSPSDPDYHAILAAHDLAVRRHEAGYADPRTGLFVLTSSYLASRGTCCGAGCRHCPYVRAADKHDEPLEP